MTKEAEQMLLHIVKARKETIARHKDNPRYYWFKDVLPDWTTMFDLVEYAINGQTDMMESFDYYITDEELANGKEDVL